MHLDAIILILTSPTIKIFDYKINNFSTCIILKNSLKKIKNSSLTATLNYLFFEILLAENITENKLKITSRLIGFAVGYFSSFETLFLDDL